MEEKISKMENNNSTEKKKESLIGKLICPLCKLENPIILNIKKDNSKNTIIINYICKCKNKPKEITLNDFYKISISNLEKKNNNKCYKHPEKEGIEYCENCKKYLCDVCKDYHKDFVQDHKTVSINLINLCNIHLEKKLNLFCEDCNLNICSECKNNKHKDHNIISLSEYWNTINNKLKFNSVEELKEKLETEKKNFDNIIDNSLEKINYLINKFEKLKNLIFDFYKIANENNKIFSEIIVSSFKDFFEKKENANFAIINNCKELMPINLIYSEECNELGSIFNGFSYLFNSLTNCESNIIKRNLVKIIDDNSLKNNNNDNIDSNNNTVENNSTQSNSVKKEIENNVYKTINNSFLNKKTKSDNLISHNNIIKNKPIHVVKIPLNEKLKQNNEYFTNNSSNQLLNKNHLKNNNKEKNKKENNINHSNDFLETFSTNVLNENYEYIHLNKEEKKIKENEINNEQIKNEDPDFFNNIFYKNNNVLDNSLQNLNNSILNSEIGITENSLNIEKC